MTAVASPPSFANLNRPGWINGGHGINSMNSDEHRGASMFVARKTMQRTNSSSSIASNSSTSSTLTVIPASSSPINGHSMPPSGEINGWPNAASRKRQQSKGTWIPSKPESQVDFARMSAGRPPLANGANGAPAGHQSPGALQPPNPPTSQGSMARLGVENIGPGPRSILCLVSLNGTFERKTISVPCYPDKLRLGRQTNNKTVPTPQNVFFDSKVLSRLHAEIWGDESGKIFIRDTKSSNGTFVNTVRLSQDNRESEPHELMAGDQLELGIDIVSEDQKTVLHHKVAAKVEHAGFPTPSQNLLEMNFSDLDPINGCIISYNNGHFRGRIGSPALATGPARMTPNNLVPVQHNGLAHQRQFLVNPATTENIVKRLQAEIRNARLQNEELKRTGNFIHMLLSKEDIKNKDRLEGPDASKGSSVTNGNSLSFRSDGSKTRFSGPPAPPPSQPLPEKPHAPSLKKGSTERPKSIQPNGSPVRQDSSTAHLQHLQFMETLAMVKKEAESQSARVRDLEEMLQKEREARLFAEDMVQKLEEGHATANGSALVEHVNMNDELEKAFNPLDQAFKSRTERTLSPETSRDRNNKEGLSASRLMELEASLAMMQSRMDSIMAEKKGLSEQLEEFRLRAEKAELERDVDRKTVAEMVAAIRERDEKERQRAAKRRSRSRSKVQQRPPRRRGDIQLKALAEQPIRPLHSSGRRDGSKDDAAVGAPSLSPTNTIVPVKAGTDSLAKAPPDQALLQGLPYASMIGVVLFGVGLMVYLNGWQPQQGRLDR